MVVVYGEGNKIGLGGADPAEAELTRQSSEELEGMLSSW